MKPLIFIPFLALLGTSCGGGHITTTPVIKNAPRAGVLNAPKRQPHQAEAGQKIAYVDLGSLSWTKTDGTAPENIYFYSQVLNYIIPTEGAETGQIICADFKSVPHNNNYRRPSGAPIGIAVANQRISLADYTFDNMSVEQFKNAISGIGCYYRTTADYTGVDARDYLTEEGYSSGYQNGYQIGYEEGQAYNQQIIANGQYTGLTAFPRRTILQEMAKNIIAGQDIAPQSGNFDMIDTNGNYTIYIKWHYDGNNKRMIFQDFGNEIIGELFFNDVAQGNWSSTWFGKYDAELHYISASRKTYATDEPITMSFYPEVYLASTINGDVNTYFMGGGNAYQLGFADGQTYTIHASETYNNVFTIFTPAFRAVADFFNLNIGPFKVWYFFAIPLIVTLLILVLRLVKH